MTRRPSASLRVEALEDRALPALTALYPVVTPMAAETVALTSTGSDTVPQAPTSSDTVELVVAIAMQDSQPAPAPQPSPAPAPGPHAHVLTFLLDKVYSSSRSIYVQRRTGFANGQGTVLSTPGGIYEEPMFGSKYIRPVELGEKFTIEGFQRGFVKVRSSTGQTGWIHVNVFIKTKYIPPPPYEGPPGEVLPGGTKG